MILAGHLNVRSVLNVSAPKMVNEQNVLALKSAIHMEIPSVPGQFVALMVVTIRMSVNSDVKLVTPVKRLALNFKENVV